MRVRAAAVLLMFAVGGCGQGGDPVDDEPVISPLADCAGLTEPLAAAEEVPTSHEPLPDLTLPCFTGGGAPFRLADLRGPAIVSLWASWCPPCREELPMLQRYADQAAGKVHLLGVVTGDRREAAASLAADLAVTAPALDDRDEQLRIELGATGLPVTAFVDPAGLVRYVHRAPLDEETLAGLVTEHLGVSL